MDNVIKLRTEWHWFIDSLNFNSINHDYCLIGDIWNNYDDFIQLKEIFRNYLELNKSSELKVLLSRIARKIKESEIIFDSSNPNQNVKCVINYMLQLIFFDAYIAVNCYKVMYELLSYYQNKSIDTTDIITCIDNKTKQLNEIY